MLVEEIRDLSNRNNYILIWGESSSIFLDRPSQVNATSGKQNGLTLLLDYQEDLSLHIPSSNKKDSQNSKRIKNLNFDTVVTLKSEAA